MPTPMDAMLGLVVTAIGLMSVVIAFLITEQKKRWISYGISGIIVIFGLYYYVNSQMRGYQTRKRIATIQQQQRVNLEEIQKRLRETSPPAKTPSK